MAKAAALQVVELHLADELGPERRPRRVVGIVDPCSVSLIGPEAADEVMRLLRRLATTDGLAVVCVLHQPELATRYADRLIGMRAGRIEFDERAASVSAQQISNLYLSETS